jgi:photosystem II stability/assembly factor-like uncharacterized protein
MKKSYIILVVLFVMNEVTAQWVQQNSGTTNTLRSVYFTDNNTGYAVGDSGTILKTTDGGLNWTLQNSGTMRTLYSIHFPVVDTGFVSINHHYLAKTTDGGSNWIIIYYPPGFPEEFSDSVYSLYFTDTDTGYSAGFLGNRYVQFDIIYNTTCGGDTSWEYQYLASSSWGLKSIIFPDKYTGYTVGYNGKILKTTNGMDWESQGSGTTNWLNSVHFCIVNTGYIVGDSGIILKTIDGGINWITQNSGTVSDLNSVYCTDENLGHTVGDNGIILKTTDGGVNWIPENSGTTVKLNSVHFPCADTGYIVGDGGTILKTIQGGYPVSIHDQHQVNNTLKIYPATTSTRIIIESIPKGQLSIVSLSGQEFLLKTITGPTTIIDVSTLPNGLYVVKLVGDKGVQVGKIVKR